jgi:tetratricopeptide (TPR) repeat protein
MKKLFAVLVLTAASCLAFGQTGESKPQTPAAQAGQSQAAPAQGTGTQATPVPGQTTQGTPATPGAQAPAPTGKRQPQAKTQEEFKGYQDAAAKPDPAGMEQAANEFAQKFPDSELRAPLYQNLMLQYQNANNGDKTIEIGRKVIQLDPDNAVALVTVAQILANRTRETDLDKEERITEAKKHANHAIELMNSGQGIPAGYPPDKVEVYKNTVLSMGYAALGQADFVSNNFPAAEQSLRKSTMMTGIQPDPISYFQLSLALDRQGKYADAMQAAQKCIDVAQGHPVAQYCTQERDGAKQRASNPPAAKPATTAPATSPQATTTPK